MITTFTRIGLLFASVLLLTSTAFAGEWQGTSSIRFDSTVTRGPDFSGTVHAQPFTLQTAFTAEGEQLWTMDVKVKVAEMDTDESKRDTDMRDMMHAVDYPLVEGRVEGAKLGGIKPAGGAAGTLPFQLTVAGVAQPTTATVTNWHETDNSISFDATFKVSLKAHALQAPSLFFMKVDDVVTVNAHIELKQ